MSLITDINFYVADGVDADLRVTAKFDQTILQDALDIVLLPVGLKWHRTGDVVSVTTDLHNKFYNLTPDQVTRLKPLLENRTLQRYLYGPEGIPPMRNVELLLDDRENLLVVTDSAENLNKIEAFLKDLQVDAPQQLVFKNWKIRPEEGQRIKALVEAIVKVNSDAAWDLDRRVVVDGDDLIVKDSADNVAKIEQLLLDKNFLRKLENQTLGVQSYSLIPREPIGPENVEQARDMAQSIVTVVKTILYSQSGEQAASAEGRRFWYDPNTLQLTITDFPGNLEIVSDYLKSLPTLSASEQKSEIIWLKHQTATEMKTLLEQVLGLTGGGLGFRGGSGGESVTKTLRTEGELTFYDLRIRVREIEENEAQSDTDDSVTLIVRTATTSQDVTLEEFNTEFIDEYEITAEDVRPSGNNDGKGSVRLRIAINTAGVAGAGFGPGLGGAGFGGVPGAFGGVPGLPGAGFGVVPGAPAPTFAGAVGASISEEFRLIIENVPNMNALLIRYTNPADLDEVKRWLKELDIPVLQVSIETKLVEVNETRAKEFMPEFNWANIGQGSPDFSNSSNFFDFAKNDFVGELGRSPFDPFPEDQFNSGLLKGTSVFNIITGGPSPISFTLRALESEGVVNLTNGPTVTVENGESAEFQISRDFGLATVRTGDNDQDIEIPRINHVYMAVTPQITQAGEIRLEIQDLELNDFGNQIGGGFRAVITEDDDDEDGVIAAGFGAVPYEVRRRTLTTVARVKNHGTIVLGGWMGERSRTNDSGIPILRNVPYVGKLLFGRTSDKIDRTNLLIFLTCHLIDP
jgi:type II secretory pathway component GspD/PulD (secretin)